jgi:hypothetical protein
MAEEEVQHKATEPTEKRSLTTDAAIALGPAIGVVTAWGLSKLGQDDAPPEQGEPPPNEIILPQGVEKD